MPKHHISLKNDAKPYHGRAYTVPKAYEQGLRKEVDRLVKLGVLKKVNHSPWGAPCFPIPKKDGTIRFISDFRELNKRVKRNPFPLPKISDMLLKLEGFQYATSLDLNMGYYHIKLDASSRKLCTIVLPWGKFEYNALPMGLCSSCDIFQEKMSDLMQGLDFVRTYIDDLLCITSSTHDDHLSKLDKVLEKVQEAGLKVNIKKSFFCQPELEYLGYWITREGIMPTPQKVQAIQNIAVPKTKKQLRSFIGMINYYRDMWIRRSEILAPLASLTSKSAKWQWNPEHQQAFDTIKKIIKQETLLRHADFNKPFEIHTDASKYQLGAVISQEGKPIAFYSRKLNSAQLNYTTTERELLAIVETLKEFRNILLGQEIKVWTDHQNLTYKTFNTERVMRWRMIAEQYGATLHYIKGEKNIVADALSRLGLEPSLKSEPDSTVQENPKSRKLAEAFSLNQAFANAQAQENPMDPATAFPLSFGLIAKEQQRDQALKRKVLTSKDYTINTFHGGERDRLLICHKGKIAVPKSLQSRIVDWYHTMLCHPGETRTEETIRQHFDWKGLRTEVTRQCKTCHICQLTKKRHKKLGHLPAKEPEIIPWERLCVDMMGP